MEGVTRKVYLIETFALEVAEYIDGDWEDVLKIIAKHFLAKGFMTHEEIGRARDDCRALVGEGIVYTDEGVSYK